MSDNSQIWTYPQEWYQFTKVSFQLRASSQVSPRPWAGGNSVYGPHTQVWTPKLTVEALDDDVWPDVAAYFDRAGGQAGVLRIGDPSRIECRFNKALRASQQAFSDGTTFSDGTGFIYGLMPPTAHLIEAAARGATFVKFGGLLPSTVKALQRGDLIEFRPNGGADGVPRLHSVVVPGNTNADGQCGVEIRPPLRAALAAGDQVVLTNATSVFHLVDDTQAEMEISAPSFAGFGFNLVEAIERAA